MTVPHLTPVRNLTPVRIFYSYSHRDEQLRDELEEILSSLNEDGDVISWSRRNIDADKSWTDSIDERLEGAHIILLLVTPDYLASDYCFEIEMKRALERHDSGDALVIPLILRPSDWRHAPFSHLQALPTDNIPVTSRPNQKAAFDDIARGIRRAIGELQSPSVSTIPQSSRDSCRIYYSYSHNDEKDRDELERYLKSYDRQALIEHWHDRRVLPGQDWRAAIDEHLEAADIILLLTSQDYLSSEYLQQVEFSRALERHMAGEARVIPILLRPARLESLPIGRLQALPRDGKPISKWSHRDEAWLDVASGIINVVEDRQHFQPEKRARTILASAGQRIDIGDIFPTAGVPRFNFERPREFNRLKAELRDFGMGLVVEGPSGIGKTTIVKRAVTEATPDLPARWIQSTEAADVRALSEALSTTFKGHLIIDDFHHLKDRHKDQVAKKIKAFADQQDCESKITVIGINRVGHALMEGFSEISGRVVFIPMHGQPDEKIRNMIAKGEDAANISFRLRDQIVQEAGGSFFTAQHFCRLIAIRDEVFETQERHRVVEFGPSDVMSTILEQFEPKYRKPLHLLASIDSDRLPKGAGLALLWLLRSEGIGYVVIDEAKRQFPERVTAFAWLADRGLIECFERSRERLHRLFFYDQRAGTLVLEDPQLAFYLKNINWTDFARKAGHQVKIDGRDNLIFLNNYATSDPENGAESGGSVASTRLGGEETVTGHSVSEQTKEVRGSAGTLVADDKGDKGEMGMLEKLATLLPKLKTKIQLTGLVVLVASFVTVRAIAPGQLQAQIAAGAIGVVFIVFHSCPKQVLEGPDLKTLLPRR